MTGHIHVGFLKGDPSEDRNHMMSIIQQAIAKALNIL